jgi:ectoine hydroxylase-related dioxygenase (phytanoyl-CoA dioxygenase family)
MLSNSQIEEFDRQGFLIFDPGIAPATIDEAVAHVKDMYLPEGVPADNRDGTVAMRDNRRIQDAWRIVPAVKQIALAPRVMEALGQIYRRKPLPFQTLNFRVGSEQNTHSDTVHFNSQPSGYMCGVWVALEDIDADNGPVVYYAGSQKWSEVALPDVDAFEVEGLVPRMASRLSTHFRVLRDTNADYAKYERVIQHRIDKSGIPPSHARITKGQAFIWAANLLHGGSPQRDRSRTRFSQVTHYFFEGCRYYTPLLRRGTKTAWRTPEWIA